MRYLKRIVVPVAIIALALSALAGVGLHARMTHAAAAIASPGCGQWTILPGANPGTFNNQLFGVAAVSANDVWAVGDEGTDAGGPNSTLIEQWNGAAWKLVASPNMSNAEQNVLESVAVVSSTDVWAVGDYYDNTSAVYLTLTEHWNGTNWTIVPSPNVGQEVLLSGVSADANNDVWAVGSYFDPMANASFTLIEHWNGTSWAVVPNPGGSLNDSALNSVVALSSSNIWAVGDYFGGTAGGFGTLIEHWNGASWSIVTSPNDSPADNYLNSVTAAGPNDIWAVGYKDTAASSFPLSLTEHWNGTTWAVVPGFTDGTNNLTLQSAAAVPGSLQILSVGDEYAGANTVNLAVRWNGSSWLHMQTANWNSPGNRLFGVAAVSASNAWAVGEYVPASSTRSSAFTGMHRSGPYAGIPQERSLILHYVAPRLGILCA